MLKTKTYQLRLIGLVLALSGLLVLSFWVRKTIILEVDGERQSITTSALTVGSLLNAERVPVGPHDRVTPPESEWLREGGLIQVEHADQVQIIADGKKSS